MKNIIFDYFYGDINKENINIIKGGVSEWVAEFKSSITPLVFKQIFQIFYIK